MTTTDQLPAVLDFEAVVAELKGLGEIDQPVAGALPRFVALPKTIQEAQDRLTTYFRGEAIWTQGEFGRTTDGEALADEVMRDYAKEGEAALVTHFASDFNDSREYVLEYAPVQMCLMGGVAIVTDADKRMHKLLRVRLARAITRWFNDKEREHARWLKRQNEDEIYDESENANWPHRYCVHALSDGARSKKADNVVMEFNDCDYTSFDHIAEVMDYLRQGRLAAVTGAY